MDQNMMPMFMQMMQQGGGMGGGMPQMQNNAPTIPQPQPHANSIMGGNPTGLPQQQQPGYFQNMFSSPSQMGQGIGQLSSLGSGISQLGNGVSGLWGQSLGAPISATVAGPSAGSGLEGAMSGGSTGSGFFDSLLSMF